MADLKRAERTAVIALCFLVIFACFAPLSEAALLASFGAETSADTGKAGLSPAVPPNMENDSGGAVFSQGGGLAERGVRFGIYGGAFDPSGYVCDICTRLLRGQAVQSGNVRIKLLEVMLC